MTVEARPDDYLLAKDSPALNMGFKQIDTSKIGLTKDYPAEFLAEVFPSKHDWQVNPYEVLPAKYVKIGLRPKADLPFQPEGECMKMGKYALKLNSVKFF